jgi:hypothetical protein
MKFRKFMLVTTLAAVLMSTGCSTDSSQTPASDANADNTPAQTESVVLEDTAQNSTNEQSSPSSKGDFLKTAIQLLGETHEASSAYFENSAENYSADGTFLIGRSYPVTAFGIQTTLYTSIDTDNVINSITVHLGENNFDELKEEMIQQLGEPSENNDIPSEAGFTNVTWILDGKYIHLYKGYSTVDLQLILPDQPLASKADPAFMRQFENEPDYLLAESEPYPALEQFIIDTYGIPEDFYGKTKYYYNLVDLNGDGREEIFAVVMGPYTSGTGGSSALIAFDFEGDIREITQLTLIHTPIIISEHDTKGMKDIIVTRSGGGAEPALVKLTSTGEGHYTSVNDGAVLDNLNDVQGYVILANDIMYDIENGLYLTLE